RKLVKPLQRQLFESIKKRTRAKLFYHCCGSVYPFIGDLLEIGIDILNPIQVSAKNMDTKRLKKEFGEELTFWGGCDTQRVLPFGTPDEVRQEVKKRIDHLAEGGGFVFNSVHNIQADVPPENVVAMFDMARDYGKYS
ncbi:MAG: uroporphyrinogen decarboxylase family protein, partial [bacterium]